MHTLLNTHAWICCYISIGATDAKAKQCQWTIHCYAHKDILDQSVTSFAFLLAHSGYAAAYAALLPGRVLHGAAAVFLTALLPCPCLC